MEDFFNKYGRTNAVRMRRDEKKQFKVSFPLFYLSVHQCVIFHQGSVFVEFADSTSVDAFLKADPKPTWEGKELLTMSKYALRTNLIHYLTNVHFREEYCEMKIKEKGLTGKAAKNRRELMTRPRGFNAFVEMTKGQGSDDKKKSDDSPKEVFLDFMGTNLLINKDSEGNGFVKAEDVPFVKGATLKFDGCGGDVSWSEIKVGFFDLK